MHLVASVCPSGCLSVCAHYQFKVFVCVSVISGHMRVIARMRNFNSNIEIMQGKIALVHLFLSRIQSNDSFQYQNMIAHI